MSDPYLKLYIAVLEEAEDHMVPTLVARSVLGAHLEYSGDRVYDEWLKNSYRKVLVKVNYEKFNKIMYLHEGVFRGYEKKTAGGLVSCLVPYPVWSDSVPNVLGCAKLWKPMSQETWKYTLTKKTAVQWELATNDEEELNRVILDACCEDCRGSFNEPKELLEKTPCGREFQLVIK